MTHPTPWSSSGRAIVAADGTVVALVSPTNIKVSPQGVPGSFDEPTMRLLRAAPALLAALKAIVFVADLKAGDLDQTRAAIAQAKGEP